MSWWTSQEIHPKTKSKFVVVFGGTFYLPNIKSLNKPKIEFDTKEYRLLNHKFNYPGNGTWQPITMKFVDMNGMGKNFIGQFDTGAFLWQIMNNTGYTYPYVDNSQFRDRHFQNITKNGSFSGNGHHISTKINFRDDPETELKEHDTWKTITTPEKSSTIANSFGLGLESFADFERASASKQRISIYQIAPSTGRENKPDPKKAPIGGIITECWHLINPIVKSVGWGDLAYDSDDLVEYELGVVYDWAIMDRTQIGKPLVVSELPFRRFMKTIFIDNEKQITEERTRITEEIASRLTEGMEPGSLVAKKVTQSTVGDIVKRQELGIESLGRAPNPNQNENAPESLGSVGGRPLSEINISATGEAGAAGRERNVGELADTSQTGDTIQSQFGYVTGDDVDLTGVNLGKPEPAQPSYQGGTPSPFSNSELGPPPIDPRKDPKYNTEE
tara:strand:+ start:1033 stop:2367 length:1335 start_codon:yes stop_codon:yes gene_type:complete